MTTESSSLLLRILSIKGRQQMNNVNALLKAYIDCLIYVLENHTTDQLAFLNERVRESMDARLI